MTKLPAKLSPLSQLQTVSLNELSKDDLVALFLSMSSELGEKAVKHFLSVRKRKQAKQDKFEDRVKIPIFLVYLDLLIEKNYKAPSCQVVLKRLVKAYPDTKWVNENLRPAEKDEQVIYDHYLEVKKNLSFLNKQ